MSRLHDSTPAEVEKILVTGAVGNVGREVVRALVARGASVRGVDLSADAVRAMHGENVEAERLDYESP
ncbi:hypothetical protein BH11MYX4_BH11MYX4_19990 [soil metagenome]